MASRIRQADGEILAVTSALLRTMRPAGAATPTPGHTTRAPRRRDGKRGSVERHAHHGGRPDGNYLDGGVKRTFDIVAGSVLAVVSLPVVVVLALVSAVAFRSWPFFVQDRLGRGGIPFRFIKVRSLPTTAPRYADKFSLDGRTIGRWGTLLRRSHLDELPQLWLVVAGRMSLVGPRPEMAAVAATFEPAFVAARTSVRPGCTGPWQVSTSYDMLIGQDTRFDLLYLDEASLRLDLRILWWTAAQVLGYPAISYQRLCRTVGDPVMVLVGGRLVDLRASSGAASGIGASTVADVDIDLTIGRRRVVDLTCHDPFLADTASTALD
ncbi:MAG: sugar transferase [Acidimicrobiales bacterium]|nr:sugar transferase [Acidimicrobiales bacterium]